MEENEYRSTYDEITRIPCVFEKALTNNQCRCSYSKHFWLADREGYACRNEQASQQCARLLDKLRDASRFSLGLSAVGRQLPHNMDIRVQGGGLRGMQKRYGEGGEQVSDVRSLVETAVSREGGIDSLAYDEIIKSVAEFKVRSRRRKQK